MPAHSQSQPDELRTSNARISLDFPLKSACRDICAVPAPPAQSAALTDGSLPRGIRARRRIRGRRRAAPDTPNRSSSRRRYKSRSHIARRRNQGNRRIPRRARIGSCKHGRQDRRRSRGCRSTRHIRGRSRSPPTRTSSTRGRRPRGRRTRRRPRSLPRIGERCRYPPASNGNRRHIPGNHPPCPGKGRSRTDSRSSTYRRRRIDSGSSRERRRM